VQLKRLIDLLVYLVVRVLICVVQAMPVATGRAVARRLAWLFCDLLKIRGRVVDENLAHAFPELSASARRKLAQQMWEHLFLLVLEVAHAPRKIHETNWRDFVKLRNEDKLVRMLISDRPLLIVTAHFGNFEVAGYVLGILGFPTYTVARTLDNPYLDRFVNRFRGQTGQHIIPKNGGYDEILAVLARGGTMTLLADQYAGPKGCWVQFFGRQASAHKAIALLALENDAPVAICAAHRLDRPLRLEMSVAATSDPRSKSDEVSGVREFTQWYTTRLEEMIRACPHQYWWLHRRWKDTRPKRGERKKAAA
jgi:Kdo2-lipid IVA lauroyltransferase/acyltransferase